MLVIPRNEVLMAGLPKRPQTTSNRKVFKNELLAAAGRPAMSELLPEFELVTLKTGEVLYDDSKPNAYVYFPESAVISHVYFAESGASVEAAMVGSEGASGLCGLVSRERPKHTAMVIYGGAADRISVDTLAAATLGSRHLQTIFYEYLISISAELGQRVACGSFHLSDERLCSWLLMLNERTGSDKMTLTHEEIATFLGINRASVSSIAKRLKDKGLINYVRGKLSIVNRRLLESVSCGCFPAALRGQNAPLKTRQRGERLKPSPVL